MNKLLFNAYSVFLVHALSSGAVVGKPCHFINNDSGKDGNLSTNQTELSANNQNDAIIVRLLLSSYPSTNKRPIVVSQNTIPERRWKEQFGSALALVKDQKRNKEIWSDFIHRNHSLMILPISKSDRPVRLFSAQKLDCRPSSDFWTKFYKQYPGTEGLIELTFPGYSTDKKTAVIYLEWRAGGRKGAGIILMLTKEEEWKITKLLGVWRS